MSLFTTSKLILLPIIRLSLTCAFRCGLPIVIVITRADQIDAAGDQMITRGLISSKGYSGRHIADGEDETEEHLKAMSWDERVEWIMQTIRTVALRCRSVTSGTVSD